MTIKEAIERLYNLQSIKEDDLSAYIGAWYKGIKDDYDEALDMAIEALEKQTPKKPIESVDAFNKDLIHLYCPSFDSHVGMYNNRLRHGDMYNNVNREICAKCGQVFDLEGFEL